MQPTQYSCLKNSMNKEPGRLQPMGRKESDTTEQLTQTPVSCVKVHLS